LDVQLLYIGGGSVVTQALLGGDVQFVRLGANAIIQSSLRGANLKMIANTINTLVFSLMSRPEIQAAKDLKGKKVGVTRLGGSTDFALELALKNGDSGAVPTWRCCKPEECHSCLARF